MITAVAQHEEHDVDLSLEERCTRVLQTMFPNNIAASMTLDDDIMDAYMDRVLGNDVKFQDGAMYRYKPVHCTWTETKESIKPTLTDRIYRSLLEPLVTHIERMYGVSKGDKAILHRIRSKLLRQAYAGQLASRLLLRLTTQPKVVFDKEHLNQLQYRNGIFDMQTRLFRPRTKTDYIRETLEYDFMPLSQIPEEVRIQVEDIFVKIQPDPEQRRIQLSFLAHAIAGSVGKGPRYKINLGPGSNTAGCGKSTESNILLVCFPLYVLSYWACNERCLLRSLLSTKRTTPCRLLISHDFSGKPVDKCLIAELVNCDLHHSKFSAHPRMMWLTCHTKGFPAWMLRQQQLYSSLFESDKSKVDPARHVYPRIPDIWDLFDDHVYKNAFLHLLLQYLV